MEGRSDRCWRTGSWTQAPSGRGAEAGRCSGLRAAGGDLARSRRTPRSAPSRVTSATSGGRRRQPGMAAWGPAVATRLLRVIRGVSAGGTGVLLPGGSCGGAAGPAAARARGPDCLACFSMPPAPSLIHSFLQLFCLAACGAPAPSGGAPEVGAPGTREPGMQGRGSQRRRGVSGTA